MKNKLIIALTLTTTFLTSAPVLVNAYTEPTNINEIAEIIDSDDAIDSSAQEEKVKSNAHETGNFKENIDKINEAYNKLSPAQKQEIDKLIDQKFKADEEIVDKLVEYKVLDKQIGTTHKQHMKDRYSRKKSDGTIYGKAHDKAPKPNEAAPRSDAATPKPDSQDPKTNEQSK